MENNSKNARKSSGRKEIKWEKENEEEEEEENIINLLPSPPVVIKKEKRYVSRHHASVVEERRGRSGHATLGRASVNPPSPQQYMKKGHRDQYTHTLVSSKHATADESRPHLCPKRPPIPTPVPYPPSERDRCKVNWVAGNVTEAATAGGRGGRVKEGQYLVVDDLTGHRQDILRAGLHPRFIFKKNFGCVPSYLQRRKKSLSAKKEEKVKEEKKKKEKDEGGKKRECEEVVRRKEDKEEEKYTILPEEEKEELLKGLYANLKEAQRKLQSLPVVCETLASKARRDDLEKTVTDLQRYIFLLQHHTLALTSSSS